MPTPVTRSTQASFPRKGSLKRVPFPQLVHDIARSKATGSLYLLSGETKKIVGFRGGKPTFVRSNLAEECLGRVLALQGIITDEQCNDTLEALRRTGKRQGELLVERGILSQGNLEYGLDEQLRAKLFEIFTWQKGQFQFKDGSAEQDDEALFEGSIESLIIGAVQQRYSDQRAKKMLADVLTKYPKRSSRVKTDGMGLIPEEEYCLQCLDGSRTTEELLSGNVEPPVPRISTLLYSFQVLGLIEFSGFKRTAMPRPKAPALTLEKPDDVKLAPDFEELQPISEYEDTPLPGELPSPAASNTGLPTLRSEDEEMFADVAALADEDSGVLDAQELAQASSALTRQSKSAEPAPDPAANPAPAPSSPFGALDDDDDDDDDDFNDDATIVSDDSESEQHPIVDEVFASEDIELLDDDMLEEVSAIYEEPGEDIDEVSALYEEPAPAEAPTGEDILDAAALTTLDPDLTLEDHREQELTVPTEANELSSDLGDVDDLGDLGELGDLDADLGDLGDLGDLADDIADLDDELGDLDDADFADIDGDLGDFDPDDIDLGDIDLGEVDQLAASPEPEVELDDDLLIDGDDDLLLDGDDDLGYDLDEIDLGGSGSDDHNGAMRFNEGEAAMKESDYATALDRFAEAFDLGFDVAELRAMAAFARFQVNGGDETTAQESLEQLDYAEQLDSELDLVHAYRGAIYLGLGIQDSARESFERALQLNPYCELAIEYINNV